MVKIIELKSTGRMDSNTKFNLLGNEMIGTCILGLVRVSELIEILVFCKGLDFGIESNPSFKIRHIWMIPYRVPVVQV